MKSSYVYDIKKARELFFDKYGIKPSYLHFDCPEYVEVKGHRLCNKYETPYKACKDVAIVYPDISHEQLLKLIAAGSGLFQISFAFERDIEDIELNVLNRFISYEDVQGAAKQDIEHIFGK